MAGRPRAFDREAALATAMEQFWRNGYEQTTVASLTEAMGIKAPSLYAAFGDKDRLFCEAASCYTSRTSLAINAALDRPTAREGIAELLAVTADAHVDATTPAGCFVLTEPRLAAEREDLRRRIAERIVQGVADGDVPAGSDAESLATFILAVMTGMSARARDGGDAAAIHRIAEQALAGLALGQVTV